MKVLYKIKFVLLLILVSQFANAQVDWTFFSDYLVEPGSKSSASFLSGIALSDGNVIGNVTSGTQSPSMGVGIGLGYVKTEFSKVGTEIFIQVRNKNLKALVEKLPLLKA